MPAKVQSSFAVSPTITQTYQHAKAFLGSRASRTIANNTVLLPAKGGGIAVVLHSTAVVTYYPTHVEIRTGGWWTCTTRERIRQFAPWVNLAQRQFAFYVGGKPLQEGHCVYDA